MKRLFPLFLTLSVLLLMAGCTTDDTVSGGDGTGGTGLFKSSGTFSFTSDKGNFTAQGVFDTNMTSGSAAGAFHYTEGNRSIVMIFAYNMTSPTSGAVVFAGVADTAGVITNGTYQYVVNSGSKQAFFGYIPNIADTTGAGGFYVLMNGGITVSTIDTSKFIGTFTGSGLNAFDTTKTITLSSGSFNTPVASYHYALDGSSAPAAAQQAALKAVKQRFHIR